MTLLIQLAIFAAATAAIIKSADLLVDNGEKLGKALRAPAFLVGILVMAIGTSLPELATSVSATLNNETDLVLANVLGSNIANVFLGLGLVAFISRKNISFKQNVFEVHFPILIMACLMVIITMMDRVVDWREGIVFLLTLATYLWFLFSKNQRKQTQTDEHVDFHWKYVALIVMGLAGLAISADFLIGSIIALSDLMGLAKSALAASLVAVGTSIPELAVGMSAVKKGNTEMLIGNILGSNIFNLLLIVPIATMIQPLAVSDQTFNIMMPFFVGSVFIYWVCKKDKTITVQEGAAMTILYGLFLGKLFGFV